MIVRPRGDGAGAGTGAGTGGDGPAGAGAGAGGAGAGAGAGAVAGGPAGTGTGRDAGEAVAGAGDAGERRLRGALWALLGAGTVVFWAALRDLPWAGGAGGGAGGGGGPDGRDLLRGLPWPALLAGALLLVVFVAAVTLCARPEPRLAGAAFAAAVLALYAVPLALGRAPAPVDGPGYARAAGLLADAVGLDGPGALLRWGPPVLHLLCLAALWPPLARAGDRLPWAGRWGVLYLAAVAGWVWQAALAPFTAVLLVPLGLAALALTRLRPAATGPPHRARPNGSTSSD
ncbi:hypothetical protein [Streptomyces sp. NRRL F-5065]|uniref:hypothetical protein n=1 Tax=Streptomyces sp. NRRL F-5065 TaxID=1463855 RepID=UPI00131CD697|nr:hypothetical protein [Streptomyces sp. NRRL F-5065]